MSTQLTHETTNFETKVFPLIVVCDEIYFQQNIGSIFRICDAFGIQKILFTGEHFVFSERKINKTSRNTHKTVPYEIIREKQDVINFLEQEKYTIIALEITSKSTEISQLEIINEPTALLIGSEIYGLSKELLNIANKSTHITMFGKNSSMNVTHALAIATQHITSKMNTHDK